MTAQEVGSQGQAGIIEGALKRHPIAGKFAKDIFDKVVDQETVLEAQSFRTHGVVYGKVREEEYGVQITFGGDQDSKVVLKYADSMHPIGPNAGFSNSDTIFTVEIEPYDNYLSVGLTTMSRVAMRLDSPFGLWFTRHISDVAQAAIQHNNASSELSS